MISTILGRGREILIYGASAHAFGAVLAPPETPDAAESDATGLTSVGALEPEL